LIRTVINKKELASAVFIINCVLLGVSINVIIYIVVCTPMFRLLKYLVVN
jgi:hypothetical protein